MRRPDNIAFGVNDPLPTKLALGLALQQLAFLGALMIIPDIYARAAGLEERSGFLDIASATLLVSALVIVLQVRALRYLGAGYYYPLQATGAVLPGMYLVASLPGSGLRSVRHDLQG
jgi:xanthine/uracil permease